MDWFFAGVGDVAMDEEPSESLQARSQTAPRVYFTLFIHFRIGPVTELSGVFGENTSDMWL